MRQCGLPSIRVGKTSLAASGEAYTLTIDGETAPLIPFKNWNQLDLHKWTARGKLPGTPAGLEVGPGQVNLTGTTVSINDPQGCAKLEKLFADWLALEWEALELATKPRSRSLPVTPEATSTTVPVAHRFRVERDRLRQVHIHCMEGAHTIATIGLTLAGFHSLEHQGLMRKPHSLQIGALHDWVEIDGVICHFKDGQDDSARLEHLLNERYVLEGHGKGHNIAIFENPVSPSGFDIQFPALVGGVLEQRCSHLTDESVALLQDQTHCGLLHKQIIVKLIPPDLIFKQKTSDGGEENLAKTDRNVVRISAEQGTVRLIDLSQPLNLVRLSARELGAVLNHPAINQCVRSEERPLLSSIALATDDGGKGYEKVDSAPLTKAFAAPDSQPPVISVSRPATEVAEPERASAPSPPTATPVTSAKSDSVEPPAANRSAPKEDAAPGNAFLPNLWLKELLAAPSVRHDWLACLIYSRMAQKFENSTEGKFGPSPCWYITLDEPRDIGDPAFKGIFLTEKGSLGFVSQGHLARFYNGVAFVGSQHSALEGIGINLVAVGVDLYQNIVFVVADDYRSKFGVSDGLLANVLEILKRCGVVVFGIGEALASKDPIEILWTVPAQQSTPNDPQALESQRPQSASLQSTG